MKQICFFILIACFASLGVQAQQADTTLGEIRGRVIDSKTKKPLDFVSIRIELNGVMKAIALTDDDGKYIFEKLQPGKYTINVLYVGYCPELFEEIVVSNDSNTFHDVNLEPEQIVSEVIVRRHTHCFGSCNKSDCIDDKKKKK